MRHAVTAVLIIGAVAVSSTSVFAQRSRLVQDQYIVPQDAYSRCHSLALQRGINVSRADRWKLDKFISDCLAGRIRR